MSKRRREDYEDDVQFPFEDYNRFSSILIQEDWKYSPYKDLTAYTSTNPYSSSNVDIISLLFKVASRPNPQFKLGIVDMSCPFTVTDPSLPDNPIIYASSAFENLTKYPNHEIVGRNCRFLQSPTGDVKQGSKREHCDTNTAKHMRVCLDNEKECQVVILNYTRTGVPFLNLVTMIPIKLDQEDGYSKTFVVGFQCDANAKLMPHLSRFSPSSSSSLSGSTTNFDASPSESDDLFQFALEKNSSKPRSSMPQVVEDPSIQEEKEDNYVPETVPNHAIEHVSQLSIDQKFTYVSPNCSILLEFSEDKMLGKHLNDFIHPGDQPKVSRMIESVKNTPKKDRAALDIKEIIRFKTKRGYYTDLETRFETFTNPVSKAKQIILYANQIPDQEVS